MAGFWNDLYVKSLNPRRVHNCHFGGSFTSSKALTKIALTLLPCLSVCRLRECRIMCTLPANDGSFVLAAEEFADVMLKTSDVEKEKQLRNMALKASQESRAGASVKYSKMSVVAQRL